MCEMKHLEEAIFNHTYIKIYTIRNFLNNV